MSNLPRRCIDCRGLSQTSPCLTCQRRRARNARPNPTNATRDWQERQRRAATVQAWVATHGWTCPGYQRPAHPATDLTADHVTPIGAGGDPRGDLAVLCRSCNGAKSATHNHAAVSDRGAHAIPPPARLSVTHDAYMQGFA
jgi:5-methylcytosine-specific restriction enzyme A